MQAQFLLERTLTLQQVAGMISEVFEYPFDLAKVRLQSQMLAPASEGSLRFTGPWHCLTKTWTEEGFRGLYRVRSPFASHKCCSQSLGTSRTFGWFYGRNRRSLLRIFFFPELSTRIFLLETPSRNLS